MDAGLIGHEKAFRLPAYRGWDVGKRRVWNEGDPTLPCHPAGNQGYKVSTEVPRNAGIGSRRGS